MTIGTGGKYRGVKAVSAGAAEQTLTVNSEWHQRIDGQGAIDVLLPAEAAGLSVFITNTADGAEALTVKDDSDKDTIVVIDQNQSALLHCNGTTWEATGITES